MTAVAKKIVSVFMSFALCLSLVLSVLISGGLTVGAEAGKTYTEELWLIADNENAMSRGERFTIEGGALPYAYETGTVYLPLSAVCRYMSASFTVSGADVSVKKADGSEVGMTVGSAEWSDGEFLLPVTEVDGNIYVSIMSACSIFSLNSFYNDQIGLVVLSQSRLNYDKTHSSLSTQIDTISCFIFDRPSATEVECDLISTSAEDEHPRLIVGQDKFDELRTAYENDYDSGSLGSDVRAIAMEGVSVYLTYFTKDDDGNTVWKSDAVRDSLRQPYYIYDENGNRLVGKSTYTYTNEKGESVTVTCDGSGRGDGYDTGGRSNVGTFTTLLRKLAFAWQMTGESRYSDAFYLIAVELDKWEHWGEGHFLNVADGAAEYALGLDWIWHAFDDEPEKRDELAAILYEKGLMKGYYSLMYNSKGYWYVETMNYISISYTASYTGWQIKTRSNNWQTVCGSGMILSALVLAGYDEYTDNAMYVISECIKNTEYCLLQYAPDGAYIESPGYWAYGTNTLMRTIAALRQSCGTDYGLSGIIGLDKSFHFAAGIADSKYEMWNYHDSSAGILDASMFYFAAELFSDPSLAAYRDAELEYLGWSRGIFDILFYDPSLSDGADELPLDYNFTGIDSVTMRSSWDNNAIFTGLHAGPAKVTHGDFDCGNFVLSMGGIDWVNEPGTENYNVSGFWSDSESGKRYRLYGKSLEGHNTIVIRNDSSMPLGQKFTSYNTAYPKINTFVSDEFGSYAVSDMTVQYGDGCISGYRGVLLTNSRSTVVLQDEISFSQPTSLTSVINLVGDITLSDDGKTATSTVYKNGKYTTLRVSLLSEDKDLKFTYMSAYDGTIFDDTYTKTGNNDPLALDPLQRLVINADDVTEYNVSVVFEIIRHPDEVVGYVPVPMSEWQTCSDEWVNEANKDIIYDEDKIPPKYQFSDFVLANKDAAAAIEAGDITEFLSVMCSTVVYLTDYEATNDNYRREVEKYLAYATQYNDIIRKINKAFARQTVE